MIITKYIRCTNSFFAKKSYFRREAGAAIAFAAGLASGLAAAPLHSSVATANIIQILSYLKWFFILPFPSDPRTIANAMFFVQARRVQTAYTGWFRLNSTSY